MSYQVPVNFSDEDIEEIMKDRGIELLSNVRDEIRPEMKEAVMPDE